MHRPVVVEIGRCGEEHAGLGGVDLLVPDKLAPHRDVERCGIDPPAHHRGDGGIMRARVGHAFEIFFRVELGLQNEAARHQVAGGAGRRAKADLLALQVGQALDAGVLAGDEHRAELAVLFALRQRNDFAAGAQLRLHVGEAAKPDQIDLLVDQRLDCGRVIVDRRELDLDAEHALKIFGDRAKLAHLFGRRLFRNCGDLEHRLRKHRGGAEERGGGDADKSGTAAGGGYRGQGGSGGANSGSGAGGAEHGIFFL